MIAAVALTAVLCLLAVFQAGLAAGLPYGEFAWGGQHSRLSVGLRVGSVVSIVIYAVIALLALDRSGAIDIVPDAVSTVGMWIVVGYFALGIPMNAISRSRKERFTMTPVVAVLAVLALFVALG